MNPWLLSHRADPGLVPIADRHYNRQKIGAPQFVPPGRCVVLRTPEGNALWVTSWPFAQFVKHAWAGCWVNSTFRNESEHLSSTLIRAAIAATLSVWPEPPAGGLITFVDAEKVRRKRDPGRCYLRAGFRHVGETKGGLLAFQLLPEEFPPAEPVTPFFPCKPPRISSTLNPRRHPACPTPGALTMTASKPKTAPTRVTMSDGSVVEFPTRIKMRKSATITPDGKIVCRLDFADGTVRMAPMPEQFCMEFAAEGIKARFAAAVASAESIAEMIKATDELQALWGSGKWEEERPVQERPLTDTEVLAHAIAEVAGKPVEAMLEWVKGQTKASRVKMEADPRVAGVVTRIRTEQAARFNGGEASPLDGLLAA